MRRASPNAMVRNEDEYRFPRGANMQSQAERRIPSGAGKTKEAPPPTSGDDASFVRTGSAEKLSLPRRTQPESAHARGRHQPDRE